MSKIITPLIQDYIVDFASNNNFFFVKGIQGDGYGVRYARISLSNNGQPYLIDSESVRAVIIGTKPDNMEICNECEIVDSSTIQFELTQQMLAVPGKGNYSIAIMSTTTNQMLKSFPFIIFSNQATFDVDYVTSSNEFTLLISKINQIDALGDMLSVTIENAELAIDDCKENTRLCIQATDAATLATSDLRKLEADIQYAENQRIQVEIERASNFKSLKEASEIATNNAITATNNLRTLEELVSNQEEGRVDAEISREESFSEAIENSKVATSDAIIAKTNAETATSNTIKATYEVQKRIDEYNSLNVSEVISNTIGAANDAVSATQDTEQAILNAKNATQDATDAANDCREALSEIQSALGIDDSKESLTMTWSSLKIKTELDAIDEKVVNSKNELKDDIEKSKEWSQRYRLSNIVIQPNQWNEKTVYIKSEKITESSIIDIYYNNSSLLSVYDLELTYTQGDGYLCFTSSFIPTENIIIDAILIESYFNDGSNEVVGTV